MNDEFKFVEKSTQNLSLRLVLRFKYFKILIKMFYICDSKLACHNNLILIIIEIC